MTNISIAVVTDNNEYGKAFALAILKICRFFIIKIFSKGEFIRLMKLYASGESHENVRKKYDLILWDGEEIRDIYNGNIVFMTEHPLNAVKDFSENRYSIYKYDPAQDAVGCLFDIYSGVTGVRPVNVKKENVRLFAFCSVKGGIGTTTLSMAVGQELARFYGNRILYLSFESIESTGEYMESRNGVNPLCRYLYEIFKPSAGGKAANGNERYAGGYGGFLQSYVLRDDFGIEAFAPSKGRNPLNDMNEKETLTFLSSVVESGRYDAVIADIGTCMSDAAMTYMEIAEKICLVSGKTDRDIREEQYLHYLICRYGESITDRMIKVKNMVNSSEPHENENMILDTDVCIDSVDNFIVEGKVKKILLENSFEANIRRLTELMINPLKRN